jgi:hypothetical protein
MCFSLRGCFGWVVGEESVAFFPAVRLAQPDGTSYGCINERWLVHLVVSAYGYHDNQFKDPLHSRR